MVWFTKKKSIDNGERFITCIEMTQLNPPTGGTTSIDSSLPTNAKKLKPAEVIVFNQEDFAYQQFRKGSAADVKKLRKTFEELKCKVDIKTDLSVNDIRNAVQIMEKKDYGSYSALVVVVLSHGRRNDIISASDGEFSLEDDIILPIVKNRTLKNKPKILIVQACKGAREVGKFKIDALQPHGTPSDIFKCYSTYEGYVSYREKNGTPFIQTLCDTLASNPNDDIESIMTKVRCLVKEYTKDCQVPSVTSTLTSKYVFGDYALN